MLTWPNRGSQNLHCRC